MIVVTVWVLVLVHTCYLCFGEVGLKFFIFYIEREGG